MTDFDIRTKNYINIIAPNIFNEIKENKDKVYLDFIILNGDKELTLSTIDNEYTIFFSTFHCHFTTNSKEDEKNILQDAIKYIKDIITEKLLIITYYNCDSIAWSTAINRNEQPEIDKDKKVVIESWNNTYFKIIEAQKNGI